MSKLYMFIFAFLIYADSLSFIPFINYWDELFTITIFFVYLAYNVEIHGVTKVNKSKITLYIYILLIIFIGLLGNILYPGIQNNESVIFRDIFAFLKFPLLMLMLSNVTQSRSEVEQKLVLHRANYISKITIIVSCIFAIIAYITGVGITEADEVRLVGTYQFIYSHPTYLVAYIVFCICMLIAEDRLKNRKYIYAGCVILFLSQRFKAYAILAIIILLLSIKVSYIKRMFSFGWKTRFKKRYIFLVAMIIGVIFYVVFINRFMTYLEWGMTSARLALHIVCLQIATDFFPLGSGFGTFASFLSGKYYSNIYTMYGLSSIQGLKFDEYNYASDTFWPWVVGQFGFIGGFIYIKMMLKFIKNQLANIRNYDRLIAFLIIWMYALLASAMEAFFTNGTGVAMALILCLFIGVDKK